MASCTSCGNDVTGKKFCPDCGTPVHSADSVESENISTNVCPRCNGVVKPGTAFCMNCGSSLSTYTAIATSTPIPSAIASIRGSVSTAANGASLPYMYGNVASRHA